MINVSLRFVSQTVACQQKFGGHEGVFTKGHMPWKTTLLLQSTEPVGRKSI
jgi:hypothetical protein